MSTDAAERRAAPSGRPRAGSIGTSRRGRSSGEPRIHPGRPPNPTIAAAARERNPAKRLFAVLGPGLVTGASDDDPSGIGTYAQAGAQFGYATLWMTIWMLPLMSAVQYICARIGLVTGRGIAGVLRQRYPRWVLYPVVLGLVAANTVNAGADIGAIAAAIGLVVPVPPVVFVVPVTLGILALQVLGSYRLISRVFKWLALALLAYVGAALFARPDLRGVLWGTLVPTLRLDPPFIAIMVALLGTTISPYLFFWQSGQVVEDEIDMGRRRLWQRQGASRAELRYTLWDTVAGMAFSEMVAFFIILATGATLFVAGQRQVASATDAARALAPLAGPWSSALLALGLVGAGVLAVPVLTGSAAYGVSEAFGWPFGLDRPPARAPQFYAVIVVATLIGMAIDLAGIDPIAALIVSAVINGLLAGPMLVLVMLIANDRSVMGARTNGRALNVLGWMTAAVMGLASIALIATTLAG